MIGQQLLVYEEMTIYLSAASTSQLQKKPPILMWVHLNHALNYIMHSKDAQCK